MPSNCMDDAVTPRVSVVIPTFNRCGYLQEAIDSVLDQTFKDFEVIVVDDGSTDGTRASLRKYGDRIRYIYQGNSGESVARQVGIKYASGDYIAFLDSDDLWFPNKLQRQLSLFGAHSNLGFVYAFAIRIDEAGDPVDLPPLGYGQTADEITMENMLISNRIIGPGSTLLVKREYLDETECFNSTIQFSEDWDFCMRMMIRFPVGCIPEPLVRIRLHERGQLQSSENLERMLSDHLEIIENFFEQPCVSGHGNLFRLKPIALAERYAFAAFQFYAYGITGRGKEALEQACLLSPERWCEPARFLQSFSEHSTVLLDTGGESRISEFARAVVANLPLQLTGKGISLSRMLGWIHMTLGHHYRQLGHVGSGRNHIVKAVRYDPTWLMNRGAASALVRSFLSNRDSLEPEWRRPSFNWGSPWVVDATLKSEGS